MSKVKVPKAVLDGIEAVRRSGLTNMLDRPVVAELAEEFVGRGLAGGRHHPVPEFRQFAGNVVLAGGVVLCRAPGNR